MSKLDETRHFIDLYMYHVGVSEVPRKFHLWACLSLLAAVVQDRIWVRCDAARVIYPNLYCFLIGPSGSGKENAINTAVGLAQRIESLRVYAGMATKQAILDFMGLQGEFDKQRNIRIAHNPHLYFVTEELAMCVRPGELAHDLLTLMTGLYVRSPYPITEGTRGRGFVQIESACVNWLAGSTDEWLIKTVPKDAIEGGFFARVLAIRGERNYQVRCARMHLPPDYQQVREHLMERVEALTWVQGEHVLSEAAQARHETWYMSRHIPNDKSLLPAFNRADAMVHKLATLIRLAEWPGTFDESGQPTDYEPIIDVRHLEEAIELWDSVAWHIPETVRVASATTQTRDVDEVRDIVKRAQRLDRTSLMRRSTIRGMNKERLDKALATLYDEGVVREESWTSEGTKPKRGYVWLEDEVINGVEH